MNKNKVTLNMVFDTQESLDLFVRYMDRYGEQMYREWMSGADPEQINTVNFDYWPEKNGEDYGTHHATNTILCPTSGMLKPRLSMGL